MAYINHFYGPEGQRNTFLTLYYVVFGRIIGLCVDFKRFFVNFVSFSPIKVKLSGMLDQEVLNMFFVLESRFERSSN